MTFEEKLGRLSEIVERLEGKAMGLEESLKLYQEGKTLSAELAKELEEAKLKIEELSESKENNKADNQ
ncbi:MAG: exodeoxyribonuclease VII small subunit [Firmicutes bacterium]|uniref:Exodeoxyribonuclease 7 small subunit n=1 Tax=Candidatus Alloenteromonas pullistercoris TaxID=2840785 RepID=A0A9D9GT88_9FIRM|nr:exodeoxyribonuclease VII small subunit [Candidatus Enteromonas pullistercoris]